MRYPRPHVPTQHNPVIPVWLSPTTSLARLGVLLSLLPLQLPLSLPCPLLNALPPTRTRPPLWPPHLHKPPSPATPAWHDGAYLALPQLSQSETHNLPLNYTLCSLIILCLISTCVSSLRQSPALGLAQPSSHAGLLAAWARVLEGMP